MIRRALASSLLVSCVGGCVATFPRAPPAADLAAKRFGVPAPGHATLYLYRNRSFRRDLSLAVAVDGVPLTSTGPRSFVWLTIPPGSHRITSTLEDVEDYDEAELDVVFYPGMRYFVWQQVRLGLWPPLALRTKLELVDEAKGRAGVMECSLIDTSVPP